MTTTEQTVWQKVRHKSRWLLSFVSDSAQIVSVITPITLVALLVTAHTSVPAIIQSNTERSIAEAVVAQTLVPAAAISASAPKLAPASAPKQAVQAPPPIGALQLAPSAVTATAIVPTSPAPSPTPSPTPSPDPFDTPADFPGVILDAGWLPVMLKVGECTARAESGFEAHNVTPDPTRGDPGAHAYGWFQLNDGSDALGEQPGFGLKGLDASRAEKDATYNADYAWRLIVGRFTYYYGEASHSYTDDQRAYFALDKAMAAWSTWWKSNASLPNTSGGCRVVLGLAIDGSKTGEGATDRGLLFAIKVQQALAA